MLRLSTDCCVKEAHPQRVDVVAISISIQKIASVEDDRLETHVRSASSGMDAIDRHEVLRVPSVGIVLILVRYRVSFSTALVPQLQFMHLHWPVSVQSVGDLDDVDQDNVARIPVQQYQLDYYRHRG
jgi:hypothetical protein